MTLFRSIRRLFCTATLAAFVLAAPALMGCDSDPLSGGAPGDTAPRTSRNDVYTFADGSLTGNSTLTRRENGVSMDIRTSSLTPGYTYTVWWVVFDAPERCSPAQGDAADAPACGEDDIFEDALAGGPNLPEVTILGAADGSLIGETGEATYNGFLAVGEASSAIFGDGLDNPLTAEVHLVLRSHGPAIPGLIEEQITTFNGGCNPGQPNEGMCEDVQYSVHQPSS